MNRSFWEDKSIIGQPDYIVVGAGLVGMSTALQLKQSSPEADVLIVEKGPFSLGASTRNAGFACFGSVSELLEDIDKFGRDRVVETVRMRWEGLLRSRKMLGDEAMGFEEVGGTEVFAPSHEALQQQCVDAMMAMNALVEESIGIKDTYSWHPQSPKGTQGFSGYIFNRLEGSIDTGKMNVALNQLCISAGIRFLFGFDVSEVSGGSHPYIMHDTLGKVSAKAILVTVNAFAPKLLGGLDVRPARNQVIVTAPIPNLQLKGCFHLDRGFFYFRNIGQRILIGGGRHLLGAREETDSLTTTEEGRQLILDILKAHLSPEEDPIIEYHWSGILGVGQDKKPLINRVERGLYIGVRMGGMGVAICSEVGRQLAGLVEETP